MDLQQFLKSGGFIAFITSDEKTMFYFSGFRSSFGYALISDEGCFYFTDSRYVEEARRKLKNGFTAVETTASEAGELLKTYLRGKRAGYQPEKTTVSEFKLLQNTGAEFTDASAAVNALAAVKSDAEIALISKSCKITEKAFGEIIPYIKEGVTEKDLKDELEYRLKKCGATAMAFDTIVAFGKNSSVPHHVSDNHKLAKNQPVLMDFGGEYGGYASDMTRTLFYGKAGAKFKAAYEVVLRAHESAKEMIRESMPVRLADKTARGIIDESAFKGRFTHSLGHGVGLNIHENPYLNPKSEEIFEKNMVFTIEPGIYLPGEFGIRIEDTALIKGERAYSFMSSDKRLMEI